MLDIAEKTEFYDVLIYKIVSIGWHRESTLFRSDCDRLPDTRDWTRQLVSARCTDLREQMTNFLKTYKTKDF